MFKIDVRNLVRNKFQIADRLHISPIDIDKMFYYEFEYFIEDLQERLKQEAEENKKQDKELSNTKSGYNMPKLNNFKKPNFNLPKSTKF